jgi:hypothetical protein
MAFRRLEINHRSFDVVKHFVNSAILCGLILMVTTAVGLNYATYDEGTFGSKGLFASGNGLSLYLGVASVLALTRSDLPSSRLHLTAAVFLAFCCLIVGTKASAVFGILFSFVLFLNLSVPAKVISTLILSLISHFTDKIHEILSLVFDVILFRYMNSDSLFSFLASGRDSYVIDAFASFDTEGWAFLRIIFGAGAYLSFRGIGSRPTEYDTLESDFFDIFFGYGLLGLFGYLVASAAGIVVGLRHKLNLLVSVWVATCIYSAAAGHVAFNAMSGICLPELLIAMSQRAQVGLKNA